MPHERWNLIDYYESKKLSRGKKLNKHAAKPEFLPDYKLVSALEDAEAGRKRQKEWKKIEKFINEHKHIKLTIK